jgi:hypothetical protein
VQATLTDAAQAKTSLTGRALFEALDRRCNGQFAAWIGALTQQPEVTDPHPWPGGLDITDPNVAQVAAALPQVVLPQLWRALAQELGRWQADGDWNSHPTHRPDQEWFGDGALSDQRAALWRA